jgi:hypothetical protein
MFTNVINKYLPQNPNHIRLFFNVDTPNGLAAGVLSLHLLTADGKKLHSHRVKSSAKPKDHKSYFYLDIKKSLYTDFKSFEWTFTTFTLKKTKGTGLASQSFEDLSDQEYLQKNQAKLKKVL